MDERHVRRLEKALAEAERICETQAAAASRERARLVQADKLVSVGQLAAGIAHEINNPVGYILSNISTVGEYFTEVVRLLRAAETVVEQGTPESRRELERLREETRERFLLEDFGGAIRDIEEGAARIREIVHGLKEFLHPDTGERRPADLVRELEKTLRICWNEIKYKAVLRRDFEPLPPVVCHPQRLNQVFVNLLINAAQAISGRGEIRVSTRVEGREAVVRIEDTGAGIAPAHLSRIFQPFFTTKPIGQGTGLGLHVADQIVREHGGRIDVRSVPGSGTEFAVRIPLSPSEGVVA